MLNNRDRSHFPHFISQTNPTPPDESDTTGQVFFDSRMIPTPLDQSDHMRPSFNPKVPGSRPGRPTTQNFLMFVDPNGRRTIEYKWGNLVNCGRVILARNAFRIVSFDPIFALQFLQRHETRLTRNNTLP